MVLRATHEGALDHCSLADLKRFALALLSPRMRVKELRNLIGFSVLVIKVFCFWGTFVRNDVEGAAHIVGEGRPMWI